ncbi:hypothetical protein NDU88_008008 [Pleurodeles waltl]|uniref:Uncharacterized protein n=1 Tax=Pleurodeles waltl TaxID=8319 RepID=A0AAV7PMX6_PLEWA|nr:hypothetical protein NDU88_008008 [Pleurodeles waltl]
MSTVSRQCETKRPRTKVSYGDDLCGRREIVPALPAVHFGPKQQKSRRVTVGKWWKKNRAALPPASGSGRAARKKGSRLWPVIGPCGLDRFCGGRPEVLQRSARPNPLRARVRLDAGRRPSGGDTVLDAAARQRSRALVVAMAWGRAEGLGASTGLGPAGWSRRPGAGLDRDTIRPQSWALLAVCFGPKQQKNP